ncbi:MAG: KpsF/GutQ family sugar-phosphate isomerase [Bacteroidota bacterium]
MDEEQIIAQGKRVIKIEAESIAQLSARISGEFVKAVTLILESKGRVIVSGMGKSGNIGKKIVATLNSTGTPSMFLHPGDAVHGDLGMVRSEDVVVCISKSGDTKELAQLIPLLKRINVKIISLLGNVHSVIATFSDVVLDCSVEEEACLHDLAPTSSTTAALVMGDAIAVALLEQRNFSPEDFALFHPGGNLGKRLLLKVDEMMVRADAMPIVLESVSLNAAILEMTSKRLGATCVVNEKNILVGIITDGDLRRLLQRTNNVASLIVTEVMSKNPKTISEGKLAAIALQEMESYSIMQLIVVNKNHQPVGMVHLHDLVKAGLGENS